MANENQSKKTDKKNYRHFKGRRDKYVEEFQWGFVHGEEPNDISDESDAALKKKPAEKKSAERSSERPRNQTPKTPPVKTTPARNDKRHTQSKVAERVKKTSADNKDFSDDDLNLPSYGRPVPSIGKLSDIPASVPVRPEKLPRLQKPPQQNIRKDIPKDGVPQKETQKQNPTQKKEKVQLSAQVVSCKEQMVWDADKRDYVPLVVSKPALPKPSPKSAVSRKKNVAAKPVVQRPLRRDEKSAEKAAAETAVARFIDDEAVITYSHENNNRTPNNYRKPAAKRPQEKRRATVPPMSGAAITGEKPDTGNIETEASGFIKLGISDTMLEALKLLRFVEPTPIQAGVFEQVKSGLDVMGQAQTGTGKTAAFCIPIIEAVEECPPGNDPVALILVPTRELAVQVRDDAVKLAYGRDIRVTACYGGKPLAKQIERLKNGVDILIGTPGRILDLMNRRALSLDYLRWIVLDEADRMLDIGFRPDIEKILRKTPKERQTLLFSATLAPPVVKLAEKYMKEPVVLDFSNKNIAVETIEQFYITVDPQRKFDALVHLLHEQEPQQAIIFTRTKRGADRLARLLANRLDNLAAIHGDLTQDVRDNVMGKFRSGKLRYLVATDVVGRGIDVSGISHIINYDIPAFCDDYVHRVGRTGRMGREGVAFTFVTVAEGSELTRIEMRIDKLLKRAELKGFEAFEKPIATPEQLAAEDAQAAEAEPPKPIFGKPVRKVRRAL